MSERRDRPVPDLLGCGLLAVTLALLFWNRASHDIWIARHDNLTAYLPWWSYLGERLRAGQIPGWLHQFSGIPFLADPQSGWMHLPAMVSFTLFDPLTAMKVKVLIELLIAGYGTYALARVYGYGPIATFAGAALFVFGPFSLFTTYCCTVRLHIATWRCARPARPGDCTPLTALAGSPGRDRDRRVRLQPNAGRLAWAGHI